MFGGLVTVILKKKFRSGPFERTHGQNTSGGEPLTPGNNLQRNSALYDNLQHSAISIKLSHYKLSYLA